MRSHIDRAFDVIDEHLPSQYVNLVLDLLKETYPDVTSGIVRNTRNRCVRYPSRIEVINALVEVAQRNKNHKKKLKELLT